MAWFIRHYRDDEGWFIAEAVGTAEPNDGVGARGVLASARGKTEHEARANLRRALERKEAAVAR